MREITEKLLFGVVLVISLMRSIQSFQIINCGSNKIKNETWNRITKKAIIVHDQDTMVTIPQDAEGGEPAHIWCESDGLFDACMLKHQATNMSETKRCEYLPRTQCLANFTCTNDKRLQFHPSAGYKCQFSFDQIKETGKGRISLFTYW